MRATVHYAYFKDRKMDYKDYKLTVAFQLTGKRLYV